MCHPRGGCRLHLPGEGNQGAAGVAVLANAAKGLETVGFLGGRDSLPSQMPHGLRIVARNGAGGKHPGHSSQYTEKVPMSGEVEKRDDQEKPQDSPSFDEVVRKMLNTPPKPKKSDRKGDESADEPRRTRPRRKRG